MEPGSTEVEPDHAPQVPGEEHEPEPRFERREVITTVLLGLGLLAASALLWTQIDLDGDGLSTNEEWAHDTDPFRADTDRDSLADGWETDRGLDPLSTDTDNDQLWDERELQMGADPSSPDTDDDGLEDWTEAQNDNTDCNNNGIGAWAEVDDDSDGRPDHEEDRNNRCNPDVDQDGVLDGEEANPRCVEVADCDGDGLDDGEEMGTEFSRLDADTFDAGLYDSILAAFQEQGQNPSGDDDADGIPDGWEGSSGLIQWGPYAPTNESPDLLLEYVRVQGPDSSRYSWLDFTPSYDAVESYIESDTEIEVQWVETTATLDEETRPHPIPSRHADYYEEVLDKADHATNPYVTTVVMNPQHDQSGTLHLGAAPIRGMLAAVDYGAHTWIDFNFNGTIIEFTPLWESIVAGDRQDLITSAGFYWGGIEPDGEYYLRGDGYYLIWTPSWFATNPRIEPDFGTTATSTYAGAGVYTQDMAQTILHELGHTLGLCHLEEQECRDRLSPSDQYDYDSSTMYTHADPSTMNFLPSEWEQIRTYITCPPQEPIQLLADDASASSILDAKYGYALDEVLDVGSRECGAYPSYPQEYDYQANLYTYSQGEEYQDPHLVSNSIMNSVLYGLGAVLVVAAFIAGRLWWIRAEN